MTGFQRLCLVTCAVIFGLIVLGGVVRHTDSGLGCPDWPRCHGRFIPRWEIHTLIEYSHRLTASIAGLLVLSILVVAWRHYRRVPAILYPSIATFILIIIQAGLGGAAVVNELPPEIVAVHLSMALTILALVALITATSFALTSAPPRISVSPGFGRIALAAAATTLVLMIIGSYVSGAGYGLACSGWPLCNGEVFPSAHAASVQVHFLHRFVALVLGIVLLALAWFGWRQRESASYVMTFAGTALLLYVAQAIVGAANIWTELSEGVGAAHLALATLLWLLLVVLNIRVHRLYDVLPHSQGAAARPDLLGASR